jgi:hypothetical protein
MRQYKNVELLSDSIGSESALERLSTGWSHPADQEIAPESKAGADSCRSKRVDASGMCSRATALEADPFRVLLSMFRVIDIDAKLRQNKNIGHDA